MRSMKALMLCLFLMLGSFGFANAWAADAPATNGSPIARDFPPGLQIPDAARPGPHFDADKATEAYLNLLSPEQRKLSDAYFEGGYWLQLWDLLVKLGIAAFLLFSGISVRMRESARRIARWRWLSTAIYVLLWLLAGFVLELPWAYCRSFVREHQYGLSTQDVAGWLGDSLKGITLAAIFLPLIFSLLYAAVRKTGARWWIWASAGSFVLFLFLMMAETVFVEPLFNDYHPLPQGQVRDAVLSLARANRIPTENVEWFDASKQTTRVSANVSGFLGTTRVNLNDNLVNTTSLPEIRAVLGHEMGHYVLNHGLRLTIYLSLVVAIALYFLHRIGFGLVAGARLGRALAACEGSRRSGVAALPAGGDHLVGVLFPDDAADQLHRAPGRGGSRRIRPERCARTEWLRDVGDAAFHLSQAAPGPTGGNRVLRPSQRLHARP